jgi:hypothetical protein
MTPEEQLRAITAGVRVLQNEHCRCLLGDVIPALASHGIELVTLETA